MVFRKAELNMGILSTIFTEVLWRPLFNGLVFFYSALPWHDLGVAIVLLTIAIRLILAPLMGRARKAQHELAKIQPEIKKIQEKYKDNKEAQTKALMEFYAANKVNPFSGCVLMLVQLPILIALFSVFNTGFDPKELIYLYSFISHPGSLNTVSFGVLDLAKGNIVLGIFAAATQYYQTKLTLHANPPSSGGQGDFAQALQWQSLYLFPLIILAWSYSLPSALTLYWTVLNLFGIIQEIIERKRLVTRD